jgi:hypothetical protein
MMERLESPEWLLIPDKYKILLGFQWADKRGYREYRYIPNDWKEEWEKMKESLERGRVKNKIDLKNCGGGEDRKNEYPL